MTGAFIVLEGIDGAGTTTQARLLSDRLLARRPGVRVHVTAEPTSGPIGGQIRQILKGRLVASTATGVQEPFDRRALALLFAADRLDHVACEIRPLVEAGHMVISDRYLLSSLAYQGLDAPLEWVTAINGFAPPPDLLVFLDLPVEVAWSRIQGSRPGREIFEAPDTLKRVAEAYRQALPACPSRRTVTLDGQLPAKTLCDRITALAEEVLLGATT